MIAGTIALESVLRPKTRVLMVNVGIKKRRFKPWHRVDWYHLW
jgi:hypothetical protein